MTHKSILAKDYTKGETFKVLGPNNMEFFFWIHDIDESGNELILRNPYQEISYNLFTDQFTVIKPLVNGLVPILNIFTSCN